MKAFDFVRWLALIVFGCELYFRLIVMVILYFFPCNIFFY
jgi:hypothetical protein